MSGEEEERHQQKRFRGKTLEEHVAAWEERRARETEEILAGGGGGTTRARAGRIWASRPGNAHPRDVLASRFWSAGAAEIKVSPPPTG